MATLDDILNGIRNVPDAISSAPINTNTLSQPSTLSFISADVAAATASLAPVAPTTAAPGAPYSAMYAFGDSLTDTGNASLATLGMVPVSPPYADRSFTNGPVWAQDLAQSLGLPALKPSLAGGTDFAYGGAETGQTPVHTLNATDLTLSFGTTFTNGPLDNSPASPETPRRSRLRWSRPPAERGRVYPSDLPSKRPNDGGATGARARSGNQNAGRVPADRAGSRAFESPDRRWCPRGLRRKRGRTAFYQEPVRTMPRPRRELSLQREREGPGGESRSDRTRGDRR